MSIAGMNFSFSSLLAGFIFGVIGMYLVRYAKREAHPPSALIGIALCIYTYFVDKDLYVWGIGVGLTYLAFKLIRS